ncbi:helix-turn-helix transcriptional regulator [Enterobacter hormaechei]|uniref:helix-turn-helix domain-containing protein n=1 Tax=Enterobacter hormaechei TaxID=158836 RepID=UPI00190D4D65|nr:helix-turn-helix transcriptional regulator [Enterobacter hormaechei]MBK4456382.1 helix-turn-helix transcriptional regulator [Enterobacter hormaechei]MBK4590542.1 helix-turn-helix transcriptional regulator [Enterobacter hormaechei]MBL7680401.1 helix-turn-helix transcriptional regulator [Enterobacter hormaechei]
MTRKSSSLTNRELEVLRKIIAGMKNIEIADSMCLSSKTISTYKTRIMTKMGVTTLVDLIEIAKREKIE